MAEEESLVDPDQQGPSNYSRHNILHYSKAVARASDEAALGVLKPQMFLENPAAFDELITRVATTHHVNRRTLKLVLDARFRTVLGGSLGFGDMPK